MSHADFEQMWRDLAPVGRSSETGGYFRTPWGSAERECADWFYEQAGSRGLLMEQDEIGNTIAWWYPDKQDAWPGVVTGSHLDSVLDGGAFDGPLGVVSAFAAVDVLRDRGFTPAKPIGVALFLEEEGSRFGLACLGSRLATGATTWEQATQLRDRDGIWFLDALEAGGTHPDPEGDHVWMDLSRRMDCFVELHVEQGRDLVDRGVRGRGGALDLAARALPVRLRGRGQPRGHDPDGGPARPDADLRDDGAGRQQAGPALRPARDVRPRRRPPERHQRRPLARHRLAGRPGRVGRAARRPGRRGRPDGAGAGRPGRDVRGADRRVGLGRGPVRRGPGAPDRRAGGRTTTGR